MTDDYAELREAVLLPSPDAGRWPRFDRSVVAALLADLDRLAEIERAARVVADLWSGNGGPMQMDDLRAALRGSGEENVP